MGYVIGMAPPEIDQVSADDEDHAVGLELQIVELVEQQQRAVVQGHPEEAVPLQAEVDALQTELAKTAEHVPPLLD
jgi:hypothetical protein